jgi:cyclophilin family peptidyl-prolyl cis-trans isomerase
MRLPALLAALLLASLLAGCSGSGPGSGPAATPAASAACKGVTRASLSGVPANHTVALLSTSKGCVVAELFDDKAPITVANFRAYASESFFDGTLFHRIVKGFMVQGGGMNGTGQFKTPTHPPIKNEAATSGLKNTKFTLSMARLGQTCNPDRTNCHDQPDSATDQFFINDADNSFLDPSGSSAGYAVFGHVVQGQDVVEAIAAVPVEAYAAGKHCQPDNQPSCPTVDVVLTSVRLL